MNMSKISRELLSIAKEIKLAASFNKGILELTEDEYNDFVKTFSSNKWRLRGTEAQYKGNVFLITIFFDIKIMKDGNRTISVDTITIDYKEGNRSLMLLADGINKDYKDIYTLAQKLQKFNKDFAKYILQFTA